MVKEFFITKDINTLISEVINNPTNMSYFTFSISAFISIIMLIMLIINATLVRVVIDEKYIKLFRFINQDIKKDVNYYCTYISVHTNKIFKINCCYRN